MKNHPYTEKNKNNVAGVEFHGDNDGVDVNDQDNTGDFVNDQPNV